VLRADDLRQLAFVERFVAVPLRERAGFPDKGPGSRLPAWLRYRPNRGDTLRSIARMRESARHPRGSAKIQANRYRGSRRF